MGKANEEDQRAYRVYPVDPEAEPARYPVQCPVSRFAYRDRIVETHIRHVFDKLVIIEKVAACLTKRDDQENEGQQQNKTGTDACLGPLGLKEGTQCGDHKERPVDRHWAYLLTAAVCGSA